MTIDEAAKITIEEDKSDGTEKRRLIAEWSDDHSLAKVIIARYLMDSLNKQGGELDLSDIAFVFIFGIRIGQTLATQSQSKL